jgi:hypothetical protein
VVVVNRSNTDTLETIVMMVIVFVQGCLQKFQDIKFIRAV